MSDVLMKIIDAHIHLDLYEEAEMDDIVNGSEQIEGLVSVSFHLESSIKNLALSKKYAKVKPAFGFHPEQSLLTEPALDHLLNWMETYQNEMVAVGEVGLPYYSRREKKVSEKQVGQYLELLEIFIKRAKDWGKPIVLHAVYDDATIVCDLLEKHTVTDAHFHWFKGDAKTVARMNENGYFISVTPDVVYEREIKEIVKTFSIQKIMVETDGPWSFEGMFTGKLTHPSMMHESIKTIADIKGLSTSEVYEQIMTNTKAFFRIE